jgi:hypothetical protein
VTPRSGARLACRACGARPYRPLGHLLRGARPRRSLVATVDGARASGGDEMAAEERRRGEELGRWRSDTTCGALLPKAELEPPPETRADLCLVKPKVTLSHACMRRELHQACTTGNASYLRFPLCSSYRTFCTAEAWLSSCACYQTPANCTTQALESPYAAYQTPMAPKISFCTWLHLAACLSIQCAPT